MGGGNDYAAGVVIRAHRKVKHVGSDAADVDDVDAYVEKTGDETLGQLWRRNARIAADDHYFRMEQVSVGPGDAVVGFLVQVCRINPSNIIGTKAFPVHDFTCFLSLSGTGLCIVSQRRLVAQNRSRPNQR